MKKLNGIPQKSTLLFDEDSEYKFCRAGFLDIPLVFHLLQDGSLRGSFTQDYMSSKGYIAVLKMVFIDVMRSYHIIRHKTENINLHIFMLSGEDIGFVKVSNTLENDRVVHIIDLCAVLPKYRNKKHGTQMVRLLIKNFQDEADIVALCTKYSRPMQRLLKNLRFERDRKTNPFRLELYKLTPERKAMLI